MKTPKDLQLRLRALGYYNGKIDGDLGPVSLAGILDALANVGPKVVTGVPAPQAGKRSISAAGIAAITQREGRRLKAYQDSRGIWTIGVGHTSAAGAPKVVKGLTITAEQSDAILDRDLDLFEAAVADAVKVPVSQNEFDAMVSMAFNIGASAFAGSSVVRKLNTGDRPGAADAFLLWKRAGNDPNILLPRRRAERLQFLTP